MNMLSKKGIIKINKRLITGEWNCDLSLVFSNVIPIAITEIEHDIMQYTALSRHFLELQEGDEIPTYDVIVHHERDREPFIEFKIVK